MIIDKVKFTKKEQSEIRRAISNDQIRYIRLRAENRYISSFGAKYGYDDNFFANYLLAENLMVGIPQEDKEKIRQDILSDVCEILSAVTKEEVEKELDNRLQEFIDVIPTDEPHRIAINVFTNRYTVNYKNCWSLLNEILFSVVNVISRGEIDLNVPVVLGDEVIITFISLIKILLLIRLQRLNPKREKTPIWIYSQV